jgi:predicted alpha/beta-hydrolase family hydrolase
MSNSEPRAIEIQIDGGETTTAMVYQADRSTRSGSRLPAALILAHGAGAGQRHPFMTGFARALSERGLDVFTFNFLYMERRRHVPDRMPQLVACYDAVIAVAREHMPSAGQRLFIGGKSMGGRAATHVAAANSALPVNGLVLLGYPLHPPGRPDQLRDAHLPSVGRPMLFVQGSRDTFGTPGELKPILDRLSPAPALHVIDGGDHSFKVGGRDAKKQSAVYEAVQRTIVEWIDGVR